MDGRVVAVCGGLATAGIAGVGGLLVWRLWQRRGGEKRIENPYETQLMVDQYLAFHYAPPSQYVAYSFAPKNSLEFPSRCAALCKRHKGTDSTRALDIGCAVGRSSFELATVFSEVVGIDYSHAFIDTANELKERGVVSYRMQVEGDLSVEMKARVDPDIDRSRVRFQYGDACNLPSDLGQFGAVLAANLICRLPEPMGFFNRLKDLVLPTGILVITSPYSWLEQYTPKDKWIGGYTNAGGEEVRGIDALRAILSPNFILLEQEDMPFLIRETTRRHQWTVAHASVWMRKIDT